MMLERVKGVKYLILAILLISFVTVAYAQLDARANRLNYFNSENLTVVINWSGGGLGNVTAFLPSGFNFSMNSDTSLSCGNESAIPSTTSVICNTTDRKATFLNVTSGATVSFTIKNYTSNSEYLVSIMVINATNGTAGAVYNTTNISLIKVRDQEIFNTLVEYGRGRGNYFYSTTGGATSAGTGTGYNYLPNGTKFELNYLHKIFNVKQYFGLPTSLAYNATWACTYPNNTMIRVHLATQISRGALWNLTYLISDIGGSFERQGYIGQQFDATETSVPAGNFYEVNCTGINYYFPDVGGNISVGKSNFTLQLRDPEAIRMTARPDMGTIGNGTTEVIVEYNITNNEIYPIEDVSVEIQAPSYATFIGTRGELFGTSMNKYTFTRQRISASTTEQVFLVVRFNTTNSGLVGTGSTDLYRTTLANFIPTWEANAYNPLKQYQTIATAASPNTIDYDMSTSARIVKLQNLLIDFNSTLRQINNTVTFINATVNAINATVTLINSTVTSINATVNLINGTVNSINATVNLINNTVTQINATINTLNDTVTSIRLTLLLVNNTVTSINATANLINNTVTSINATANLINSTVNSINATVNLINNTVTSVNFTVNLINGTTNSINTTVLVINATTNLINNTVTIINATVSTNLTTILYKIQRLQEFDEELVFLVTDSFGLRDQAAQQAASGDVQGATESLKQANEKLAQAVDIVTQRINEQQAQPVSPVAPQLPGLDIIAMFSIMALIGVSGYLHYHKYPTAPQQRQ